MARLTRYFLQNSQSALDTFVLSYISRNSLSAVAAKFCFCRSLATCLLILIGRACVRWFRIVLQCIVSASVHVDAAQTNKKNLVVPRGERGRRGWLIVKTSWRGSHSSASYYFSDSACECCYRSAPMYTLTRSLRETYSPDVIGAQYRFHMKDRPLIG